jgi:hypothetical protein
LQALPVVYQAFPGEDANGTVREHTFSKTVRDFYRFENGSAVVDLDDEEEGRI